MRKRGFHQSLRLKVTAGVLFPLLAVLSVLSYARYLSYQDLLMAQLRSSAASAGKIIEASMQHAMRISDFLTVQQIVDSIGKQPGVRDVLLLSKSGEVLVSTREEMNGETINLDDATCQACHRHRAISRNESVVLDLGPTNRVFRNVNAIENAKECQGCHNPQSTILGVLISDLDMAPVERALTTDRRSSLLWSVGCIVLITLITNFVMSKLVIGRLEHFLSVIRQVIAGDLDARVASGDVDEIGELGRSFNHMADGLKDRERLEQDVRKQTEQLRTQAERLSTLNTVAATVSQTLNLTEILDSALDKVLELMQLDAGWIVLRGARNGQFGLVASRGLPQDVALAHMRCSWNQCVCSEVLELGQPRVFRGLPDHPCPTAKCFAREGPVFSACVPLVSKDRVLGVMSLVGGALNSAQTLGEDTVAMLQAIGRQIGVAAENASLYDELRQEELLRRRLLERVITVQEEERRRIALELHDQTGQSLTSLIMTLSVLGEAKDLAEVRSHLQDARDTAAEVLKEVHDLALELRPTILDDLGLLAALRHMLKRFQDRFHLVVDFQTVGLDRKRLSPEVETALYRMAQEMLTNVARHAQAQNVSVLLEHRGSSLMLIVEDDGKGFDPASVMATPLQEQLGVYGMRERASLLGGTLTIESSPGMGTAIFVEVPLNHRMGVGYEQDPHTDS